MTPLHRSRALLWAIFIVFCLNWFYTLAPRTLIPSDEGRYAEMAREMAATGDWITPRLNGIKYFEKPPLQTWMNALTFKAFGLGEWQARLWTGLTGFLSLLLVAYTGRRLFNARVGIFSGMVLASSYMWFASSHFNTLDMGLSAMMTLSLCALLIAQRDQATPTERRNWMLACWAGMALAVLSKGLIGVVLPGAVLVLYTLVSRDWAIWKRLHLGWGLLLFFAIATPWFVLVSLKNPEFPRFFFIHEHFERFTSKIHRRTGPIWYFIPILILGIMPWLGVLVQSLWRARHEQAAKNFKPRRMLLIWAGFIFFFFSISGSKLPSYIMPIFPALALLIGCYLQNIRGKMLFWSTAFIALLCAIGLAYSHKVAGLTDVPFEMPLYQTYAVWITATAATGLVGSLLALLLVRKRLKDWAILVLATTGLISMQLVMFGHEPLGVYAAGTLHLPALRAELRPDTPLYTVGKYEQALPFYLQRTMIPVVFKDEQEFGLEQEPWRGIATIEPFIEKWKAERAAGIKAVAIMSIPNYEDLKKRGLPMRIIGEDPRRVIVANNPKE
ncbi:MAG: glycosyltransferase family 39 protein [Proteobacteria bacterium]|nr:glycosyltransferase family 39 protein [Pseudomonadota bacterium]